MPSCTENTLWITRPPLVPITEHLESLRTDNETLGSVVFIVAQFNYDMKSDNQTSEIP
jgi:hypothetical protein